MARDCGWRCFRGALIGTYKRLILGGNFAVSDFRDWLLHGCTGSRYKFRRNKLLRPSRNRFRCASGQRRCRCPGEWSASNIRIPRSKHVRENGIKEPLEDVDYSGALDLTLAWRARPVSSEHQIRRTGVSFEPNSLTATLNHRCGETYLD